MKKVVVVHYHEYGYQMNDQKSSQLHHFLK